METYKVILNGTIKQAEVNIYHKPIKNVHLKVFRDLKVNLSVPLDVPDDWIIKFLEERKEWISKQLDKYQKSKGYNNLMSFKSGSSTQYLGKDKRIIKELSPKNYAEEDEKKIILHLKDTEDKELSQRVLEKWWREQAQTIFSKEVDALYESVFRKYNIEKPTITIRKMKTLWGSCTPAKCKITLNEYLLKADSRCIQYVVLHELTHLLYPYHNNDFYSFLTIHMPDWKERKKELDLEVVQGL